MRHQSLLAGAALAVVSLLAAGAVQAQDAEPATTITWKGAPELKWGEFTFKPRGRSGAEGQKGERGARQQGMLSHG